jgi:hypothetical protein
MICFFVFLHEGRVVVEYLCSFEGLDLFSEAGEEVVMEVRLKLLGEG